MARDDGSVVAGVGRVVHRSRDRRTRAARDSPKHRARDGRRGTQMSWLLPSALGIAAVAALAAVALHFIARSRPVAEPLPTARFIPNRPIHARTRSFALTDLLLLAM